MGCAPPRWRARVDLLHTNGQRARALREEVHALNSDLSITELTPLARGGMAELHLGRMRGVAGVETFVVIKRILPTLSHRTDFVEMFISEARVAAVLNHPNIVQTYRVGEDEQGFFIAMEYLQGADLRHIIGRLRKEELGFPQDLAIQILIGVLGGLHYAHERRGPDGAPLGIVHRDISPHNIYVTRDGSVKLFDFGVAKATNNLNPDENIVQGRLRYMSPEQCLNAPVDPRSDVYSSGVMLYEMLTGRRAHPGGNRAEVLRTILDQPVLSPTELGIQLPPDLEPILMRSVQKRRGARFQSALEFQRALEDYCQNIGIFPSPSRLGEWVNELVPTPQSDTANRTASLSQAPAPPSLRSTPHADLSLQSGVTVVQFHGRLNESFDGRSIGDQLDGATILDLHGIERITSFGIRSWLEMLSLSRARPLYFARIPESFINQVSMVRGLLGPGRVASFEIPYLCPQDQHTFPLLISGKTAQAFLDRQRIPDASCPRDPTHSPAFDEDIELFDVLMNPFDPNPPPPIVRVLDRLDTHEDLPPIEKVLDESTTTVHIRCSIDESLRWSRLLDGLEGDVIFDFTDVRDTTPQGLNDLRRAIEKVIVDLDSLTLRAVPRPIWDVLHASQPLRRKLWLESLAITGECEASTCNEHNSPRSMFATPPADPMGGFSIPPCKSCSGTISSPDILDVPGFKGSITQPHPTTLSRRGCLPGMLSKLFRA